MKNRLHIVYLILACVVWLCASTQLSATAVTGVVADAYGNVYAGGSIAASLQYFTPPTVGGVVLPGNKVSSGPFILGNDGSFSIVLTGNDTITPSGTTWDFTFCGNTIAYSVVIPSKTVCFTLRNQSITGPSVNLTTAITPVAIPLGLPSSGGGSTVAGFVVASPIVGQDMADAILTAKSKCEALYPFGCTIQVPAGQFNATCGKLQFNFPLDSGQTLQGLGGGYGPTNPAATSITCTTDGYGIQLNAAYNASVNTNFVLKDIEFISVGHTTTHGGVEVLGSNTFVWLRRVGTLGFAYGRIFDQCEICYDDDFMNGQASKAGVWLVNGPALHLGALTGVTNVLAFTHGQMTPNNTGVGFLDDGGSDHTFTDINYQGGMSAFWVSDVSGLKITGGDYEAGQCDSIVLTRFFINFASPCGGGGAVNQVNSMATIAGANTIGAAKYNINSIKVLANQVTATFTVNVNTHFDTDMHTTFENLGNATFLNGQTIDITSIGANTLTGNFTHADYGPTAETQGYAGNYGVRAEFANPLHITGALVDSPYPNIYLGGGTSARIDGTLLQNTPFLDIVGVGVSQSCITGADGSSAVWMPCGGVGRWSQVPTITPPAANLYDLGSVALPYRTAYVGALVGLSSLTGIGTITGTSSSIWTTRELANFAGFDLNLGTKDAHNLVIELGGLNMWEFLNIGTFRCFSTDGCADIGLINDARPTNIYAKNSVNVNNGAAVADTTGFNTTGTYKQNGNQVGTIASGTATMTTGAIGAGACGTTVTVAAANTLTTDSIEFAFNAAPAVNPAELVVSMWPTANNVNFQYCNPSAGSITPNAATLNWRVMR